MKKEYVKPYLALESFQLVAAVAGSCNEPLNHSIDGCTFTDEANDTNNPLFGNSCDQKIYEFGTNDEGICYNYLAEGGMYLTS